MFGSFTERAQRVLYLSQEEARKLGHSFVGTEHVLLALTHESQGVAGRALHNMGVEPEAVRHEVESIIGRASLARQRWLASARELSGFWNSR